jgi:hypothetical protein
MVNVKIAILRFSSFVILVKERYDLVSKVFVFLEMKRQGINDIKYEWATLCGILIGYGLDRSVFESHQRKHTYFFLTKNRPGQFWDAPHLQFYGYRGFFPVG